MTDPDQFPKFVTPEGVAPGFDVSKHIESLRYSRDPGDQAEYDKYLNQHTEYLGQVIDGLEAKAAAPRSGLVAEDVSDGKTTPFAIQDGRISTKYLSLAGLGLPTKLPEEGRRPLGVLIEEDTDGKKSVRVITSDEDNRLQTFVLENLPYAATKYQGEEAQWVWPGRGSLNTSIAQTKEVTTLNQDTKKGVVELGSENQTVKDVEVAKISVIRPSLTAVEKRASEKQRTRAERWRNRLGALGAAAAGLALILSPIETGSDHAQDNKAVEITQASDMVQQPGTAKVEDVRQAEKTLDASTLNRARNAFDAYFKGDQAGLKAQAEQQGYKSEWMDQSRLEKVSQATSFEELDKALNDVMEGTAVEFHSGTPHFDAYKLNITLSDRNEHIKLEAGDLQKTKEYTQKVLTVLNTFDYDSKILHEERLDIVTFKDIIKLNKEKGERDNDAYHMTVSQNGRRLPGTSIILSLDVQSTGMADNAAHEVGHRTDEQYGLSSAMFNLNPDGVQYAGLRQQDIDKVETHRDGKQVFKSKYAGTTAKEDTAENSIDVFKQGAEVKFEASPRNEKLSSIIFEMEEREPGFTASFLAHIKAFEDPAARIAAKPEDSSDIEKFLDDYAKYVWLPAAALLASFAGTYIVARRRKQFRSDYALAAPAKTSSEPFRRT